MLVGALPVAVPVVRTPGNAVFGALILTAVVLEFRMLRRGLTRVRRGYAYASFGCLLIAFVIWNIANAGVCDPQSLLQGHAAWHLLCAVAAYLLFRLYCSERVTDALRPVAVGSRSLPAVDR